MVNQFAFGTFDPHESPTVNDEMTEAKLEYEGTEYTLKILD